MNLTPFKDLDYYLNKPVLEWNEFDYDDFMRHCNNLRACDFLKNLSKKEKYYLSTPKSLYNIELFKIKLPFFKKALCIDITNRKNFGLNTNGNCKFSFIHFPAFGSNIDLRLPFFNKVIRVTFNSFAEPCDQTKINAKNEKIVQKELKRKGI